MLGERPRRRDLLIEHLHLIQDRYGALAAAHLAALAHEMRLGLSEVYEVATFYAHFDVVKEASKAPPPLTLRVCDSLSCALAGAGALFDALASTDKTALTIEGANHYYIGPDQIEHLREAVALCTAWLATRGLAPAEVAA